MPSETARLKSRPFCRFDLSAGRQKKQPAESRSHAQAHNRCQPFASVRTGTDAGQVTTPRGPIGALLVLAIAIIYGQTLDHALLAYDDSGYVTDNPYVNRGITGEGIWWAIAEGPYGDWFPLAMLSHMLDCQIFGLRPGGIIWSTSCCTPSTSLGLFFLCRRMTGQLWPSALVAALFAVHPQHVESVAWIAERRDMLSGLFFVLALWAYLDYVGHGRTAGRYLLVAALLDTGTVVQADAGHAAAAIAAARLLAAVPVGPAGRRIVGPSPPTAQTAASEVSPVAVDPAEQMSPLWLVVEKLPLLAWSAGTCLMTMRHGEPASRISIGRCGSAGPRLRPSPTSSDMFYPAKLVAFYCYPAAAFRSGKRLGATGAVSGRQLGGDPSGGGDIPTHWSAGSGIWECWCRCWDWSRSRTTSGPIDIPICPRSGCTSRWPWAVPQLARPTGRGRQWMLASCAAAALARWLPVRPAGGRSGETTKRSWRHALACDPENAKAEFALANGVGHRGQIDEAIALYRRAEEHPIDAAPFSNLGAILASQGKTEEAILQYRQAWRSSPTIMRPTSIWPSR